MLIRPEVIERLAEILEGIPVAIAGDTATKARREASILVYHSGRSVDGSSVALAGESPLLDITLIETDNDCSVLVNSAMGMVELHGVEEIRMLESTEEVAFYRRESTGTMSILTLSSRGVLQVYICISESLAEMDLPEIADEDLRAAVALKIFSENAEVFRGSVEA